MTNGTSGTCPFCSTTLPPGSTICPSCGAAVSKPPGGGPRPLGGFGAPPGPGFGPPGSPPAHAPPVYAPPAYLPPGQLGPPMGAAYPASSSGGAKAVVIVIVVIGVLLVGAVAAGVAVSLALRSRDADGIGSESDPIPIALGVPVQGEITDFAPRQSYTLFVAEPTLATVALDGDFDNYLELYDASSPSPFMQDDDSGNGLNAQITTLLGPGVYRILVRPFSSGRGSYTLTVTGGPAGGEGPTGMPGGGSYGPAVVLHQTLQGLVTTANGPAPVPAGTACSVEIGPAEAGSMFNCRVRVLCGGAYVYGAGTAGYNSCTLSDPGGPQEVEAHDNGITTRDGDPMLDLQTVTRHLRVSDGAGAAAWTLDLQLGPAGGPGAGTSI